VLILSNKPASVKEDLTLTMPRPRNIAAPDFVAKREYVEDSIKWW
jgi:sulfonate transport system ATP-binding protein